MKKMYGWMGQRLRIDLTQRKFETEPVSNEDYKKWIGGRGLNAAALGRDFEKNSVFDPENLICFSAGPLAGSFAPLVGRAVISSFMPSSPGRKKYKDAHMGGAFGPMMKYAGFDQIIIKGRSEKPVYIFVDEDNVEFHDATDIWGKGARETGIKIRDRLGDLDIKILAIGPSGENLLEFASIINGTGTLADGTGMGAVMGAKNLKAIGVKGSKPVNIAHPREFMDACWKLRKKITDNSGKASGENEKFLEERFGEHLDEVIRIHREMRNSKQLYFRHKAGWACPLNCGSYVYMKEGKYRGFSCQGHNLSDIFSLGPNIGIGNPNHVAMLAVAANDLGLESPVAGGILAAALDALENGGVDGKDMEIIRGDAESYIKFMETMAAEKEIPGILKDRFAAIEKTRKESSDDDFSSFSDHISKYVFDIAGCCVNACSAISHIWEEDFCSLLKFATGVDFTKEEIFEAAKRTAFF